VLEKGVKILDGKDQPYFTKPARIEIINENRCRIAITEGKFHQVKRMFEAVGNEVVSLKRQSIGGLVLDPELRPGQYKELSFSEMEAIFR
jgi:16S rRNA pseudouridine516 synthase